LTSNHGLLTTVCFNIQDQVNYAFEGAVEIAGAAIEWAKETL